jgi:hypothetical protein
LKKNRAGGANMTLTEWAAVAEIVAGFAVVASLLYLGLQIRQSKASAVREAAFEMIRSIETAEFQQILRASFDIPRGLTQKDLEARFKDNVPMLYSYFGTWESLGIMVHRGHISLDLVCDFFSHPILSAWGMAERLVVDFREAAGRDTPWEWFQWLAERVELVESKKTPIPAYIEYKDWSG